MKVVKVQNFVQATVMFFSHELNKYSDILTNELISRGNYICTSNLIKELIFSYNYHLIGAKLIKNLISSDISLSENCIQRANR